MSVCCERNLANIALVGLYTFVDAIVNLKIAAFSEKFPANFALKRFNALMSSNVNFQPPCPRVCFLAVRTFKRQLTCVNQFMSFLMTFRDELFATPLEQTHKWTFTRLQTLLKL